MLGTLQCPQARCELGKGKTIYGEKADNFGTTHYRNKVRYTVICTGTGTVHSSARNYLSPYRRGTVPTSTLIPFLMRLMSTYVVQYSWLKLNLKVSHLYSTTIIPDALWE